MKSKTQNLKNLLINKNEKEIQIYRCWFNFILYLLFDDHLCHLINFIFKTKKEIFINTN